MSKRFGRQQKRKLKEKIDQLEATVKEKQAHSFLDQQTISEQQDIISETGRVLGDHFITLEPETIEIRDMHQIINGWRRCDTRSLLADYSNVAVDTNLVSRLLPVLYCSSRVDEMRNTTHIRFTRDGEQVGYAITNQALQMLGKHGAAERFNRDMSRMMVERLWDPYMKGDE